TSIRPTNSVGSSSPGKAAGPREKIFRSVSHNRRRMNREPPDSRLRSQRGVSPSLKTPLVRSVPWLVVLALLLAAEVMVRLLFDPLDAVRYFTNGGLHAHDAEGARTFVGDPDLGWKLRPDLRMNDWLRMPVTTTLEGFRADHEFPRPKRGPRIVCVGDSVTFGYGILAPDQVYPGVLERMLRQRVSDEDIDVVPMGVPAYSSLQGRLWLAKEIDRLDPNLVTILFGFNDTSPGASDAVAL